MLLLFKRYLHASLGNHEKKNFRLFPLGAHLSRINRRRLSIGRLTFTHVDLDDLYQVFVSLNIIVVLYVIPALVALMAPS